MCLCSCIPTPMGPLRTFVFWCECDVILFARPFLTPNFNCWYLFPTYFSVRSWFYCPKAMSVKEKLRAVHAKAVKRQFQEVAQSRCSDMFWVFFCKFQFKRSLEHIGALKPYPNQKVQFLLRWCLEPWATQKRSIHYTSWYIPFVELTWFQRTILWDPVGKVNYTYSTISSMFLNIFRISFPTPPSYQNNTFYPALWLNIFVHEFSTKHTNTHTISPLTKKTVTLPETNIAHENHHLYWKIPSKW